MRKGEAAKIEVGECVVRYRKKNTDMLHIVDKDDYAWKVQYITFDEKGHVVDYGESGFVYAYSDGYVKRDIASSFLKIWNILKMQEIVIQRLAGEVLGRRNV